MTHWIHRCVNYQVNLRAIASREPRNPLEAHAEAERGPVQAPSTLAALAEGLGHLRALGVTQLHLMPPFEIGRAHRKGIGSPYAIRDYTRIDAEYGAREELGALIRRAKAMGFTVILGMVPNHTSRDHAWVASHPSYYVRGADGQPAYDADWSDTAKLDYRNPDLRRAMTEVYHRWLSFPSPDGGVDGFRVDMAHVINDRSYWDEALPELRARHPGRDLLFLAECYGTENNLDLFRRGFDAAYDDDLYKCWVYFLTRDAEGRSHRWVSPEAARNGDFAPAWRAFQASGLAGAVREVVDRYLREQARLPRPIHLARYTDNHDEGRGLYRFGTQAVRAVCALVHFLPQTIPFLLAGQEFGALNRPSIHERFGLCDKGYTVPHGAHAHTVPGIEMEGNLFARTPAERAEWRSFHRGLIGVRLGHPALLTGATRWIDTGHPDHLAFERLADGERLLAEVNLGPGPLPAPAPRGERLWGAADPSGLGPWETRLTRLA